MSEHTAVHGSCGCSVTLRKTCDCPNAAQVDVTQCPMHEAAPDLLAALGPYRLPSGHFVGCLRAKAGKCEHVCKQARAAYEKAKNTQTGQGIRPASD